MALLKFIFGDDVAACLNRQYKDEKAFSQIKAFGIGNCVCGRKAGTM
jgi:hypothetical protein